MSAESYFPDFQTLDIGEIFFSGAHLSVRASYKDRIKYTSMSTKRKVLLSLLHYMTLLLQDIGAP